MLAGTLGDRLAAYFVREERPGASEELIARADANEAVLAAIVPDCRIFRIEVFADDSAPVGGTRIAAILSDNPIPAGVTDVILDLSALSIGIGFPAARILLEDCEAEVDRAFHLMITSNPELDDRIVTIPSSRTSPVRGFAPPIVGSAEELAQIWIPQLAHGRTASLTRIGAAIGRCYKICPLLPFPSRNPRRADDLLSEYQVALTDEWEIDPRDILYASEKNPLDCYRTLSTLKKRFDRAIGDTYEPRMILSPVGSKVLAAGALMAAIEHEMAVHYQETESYSIVDAAEPADGPCETDVHLILSGPLYGSYDKAGQT
ncbi:hypothetical protein SAMN04487843_11684 [Methylobacterium sp. ap11]|uniref:hypothetical protein n=1 Tax=Methylobacterium sp. ap11 TaxID=1761799 RepID=UPI0008BA7E8C|nr:hypothetical protein [Methylobacterium sp. ap11]SEP41099.1 hypothetical protein SAMN04487843_11684 [Methylobacterium sp. ap11]